MNTGSVLAQFTITLSQAAAEPVAVDWYTSDGTAVAGVDYAPGKGVALFAPGELSKVVDVLVYGRAVGSEDRSFFVEMLPPTNAILGASIGECIIHVDTTGSTPVTQVIVPTGPQGVPGKSAYQVWLDLGNTGTEQDFIDSLSPSPEEIAEEVAPLLDMGESPVTAEGTELLSKPDTMKLKELARRVAYVLASKIATVTLADGDNIIDYADLAGDVVDFSSISLYPRILRGSVFIIPQWSIDADSKLLIKNAVSGDILHVCQYDIISEQAAKNVMEPIASTAATPAISQAREALRRSYADAGYNMVSGSFQEGGTLVNDSDVLLDMSSGKAYSGPVGDVAAGTDPTTGGFIDRSAEILRTSLSDEDSTVSIGGVEAGAVARLNLGSVQELKIRTGLSVGQVVRTGMTCWKIVPLTPTNVLPIADGLAAFPLNGAWLDDWGVDRTGALSVDTEFEEALSIRRAVMLGQGKYRVNTKKVLPSGATVHGVSEHSIIDARMTDVLFEFPIETGRNVKVFRDFHVYSTGNEMSVNGVVFKFPGVASGADVKYTSGYKFENIEIGGGGAFGCIWDLSDTFRLTVRDCGYTSVTNPIRIRGSVVQCTIDNLTGNNTSYSTLYDGQNAGAWMETKTYSDGVKVPENVKFLSCGFVTHVKGIRHTGLAIRIQNCDLDFIRDVGTEYGGGDGHVISGGYIAHSSQNFPFVGSRVQKTDTMNDVAIRDVTYSTYAVVASKQTAVQIGDGAAAPYAEPAGPAVTGIKVVGRAASWDFGVQADRCAAVTIDENFVKSGVIKAGGKAINASNAKSLSCCRNKCRNQEIYITAPDPVATVTATDNLATVVTAFMAPPPQNIEIARNRVG